MLQNYFMETDPIVSEGRNWKALETRLAAAVKLACRPVAVAYIDKAPDGVEKFVQRLSLGAGRNQDHSVARSA
jgi:hypothetical protein